MTDTSEQFDVMATLTGGGKSAQVDALTHGISKALLEADAELRIPLKRSGLLTRDPRNKERKKYGQKGQYISISRTNKTTLLYLGFPTSRASIGITCDSGTTKRRRLMVYTETSVNLGTRYRSC